MYIGGENLFNTQRNLNYTYIGQTLALFFFKLCRMNKTFPCFYSPLSIKLFKLKIGYKANERNTLFQTCTDIEKIHYLF